MAPRRITPVAPAAEPDQFLAGFRLVLTEGRACIGVTYYDGEAVPDEDGQQKPNALGLPAWRYVPNSRPVEIVLPFDDPECWALVQELGIAQPLERVAKALDRLGDMLAAGELPAGARVQ